MQEGTPIKIDHLGAKNCVTGSCHLMQIPVAKDCTVNILVDCGKAQGKDPELPFDAFPAAPGKIDYLFLTHAHIDHIGRVPDLIEAGFTKTNLPTREQVLQHLKSRHPRHKVPRLRRCIYGLKIQEQPS